MKENNQVLSKFLAQAEERYSEREFFNFLSNERSSNPKDFMCLSRKFFGDRFALVLGEHVLKRAKDRLYMIDQILVNLVDRIFENDLAAAQILSANVVLSENATGVVPFGEEGITGTVVVLSGTPFLLVFECGFRYVRVKTVWNIEDGLFFAQPHTKVIKITANGGLETNLSNIPEVCLQCAKKSA